MESKIQRKLEAIRQEALRIGASKAEVIPTSMLVVREAARAKCYIPLCKYYGSSLMCPPHNPLNAEATRRIVEEYTWGIVFQVEARVEDFVGEGWRERHVPTELKHKEILAHLEGMAFYEGFPLAMGFGAGECSLCLPRNPCRALQGEECLQPLKARPAMEACGFDVFALAKNLNWPIVPIGHRSRPDQVPCASLMGLILVV